MRPDDQSPGDAVLNAMWVAPEARRRGAARALCDACAAWAAEHGFRALNLAVVIGNDAAQRAYEAAGFVPSHTTTWVEEGRTLEELILTRRLAPAPAALTIAWMRAFSAAMPSPTTAAISRGLVPARRMAKIGRSRGSSRPAARACWPGPTSGIAARARGDAAQHAEQLERRARALSTTPSTPATAAASSSSALGLGRVEHDARPRRLDLHPPREREIVEDERRPGQCGRAERAARAAGRRADRA